MPILMVSTVGTAILTNDLPDQNIRSLLVETANLKEDELAQEDREVIDRRIEQVQTRLKDANHQVWLDASAEINGILAYAEKIGQTPKPEDHHILLTSDTYQGRATAALVKFFLEDQFGCTTTVYTPAGLSTKNRAVFSAAMVEVIEWCEKILPDYRKGSYRIVFNLTGGFKSVQGYMNTLGMLYADEITYIFQPPARELIVIPRLPIRLEADAAVRKHAMKLGMLTELKQLPLSTVQGIPESFLEIVTLDGEEYAALSVWGAAVWKTGRNKTLGERLLDWPRITYSYQFQKDFDRRKDENERVALQDTLAKASGLLETSGGDIAALKRDGGLQYTDLHHTPGLADLRVSLSLRVTCNYEKGSLHLRRFGPHDVIEIQ